MQITFGRVRRKTSPAVAREVGVRNPSHKLLKCPFIFGLHYKMDYEIKGEDVRDNTMMVREL